MRRVYEVVPQEDIVEGTHTDPYERQTVHVSSLWTRLRAEVQLARTHAFCAWRDSRLDSIIR